MDVAALHKLMDALDRAGGDLEATGRAALEALLSASGAVSARLRHGGSEIRLGEEVPLPIRRGLFARGAPLGEVELAFPEGQAPDAGAIARVDLLVAIMSFALDRARLLREVRSLPSALEEQSRDRMGQAVRAERMVALGTLAQGVVGELEQPLTAVHRNLRSIVEDLDRDAKRAGGPGPLPRRVADHIHEVVADSFLEVERLARLAQDVRRLVPSDASHRVRVDVTLLLQSALNLTRHRFQKRAEIRTDFAQLPEISCHADRLVQAFANLLVNAADAIGGTGALLIRTRRRGARVSIEFADTGVGIPAEELPRIFDPFFTTKRGAEGAGLGLSIVREVVTEHGGEVLVESELGEGTRFELLLPIG